MNVTGSIGAAIEGITVNEGTPGDLFFDPIPDQMLELARADRAAEGMGSVVVRTNGVNAACRDAPTLIAAAYEEAGDGMEWEIAASACIFTYSS